MDVRTYNFECTAAALNAASICDANNFYALDMLRQ